MAIAEELVALLGFKVHGEGEMKRWQRGIREGEQQAKRSASAMGRVGDGARGAVAGVGKLGAAIGVAGAGAIAKQAVVGFADLERRMSRIGITAGASVAETTAATSAVQDLAGKFKMPLDQARAGLDSLVASGMDIRQAMAFLPSVLQASTASGADTADLANTAQTIGRSFGIASKQMDDAFDILVTGGKAGQFELKDMARYIPGLASRFSALGYKGTAGLKSLVAVLQTLRERTGTAETANVQAENLFAKIYSDKTLKNFKEKGIDLRKELEKSKKSGEDFFVAFGRLTKQALKGDFSKITDLFDDQELQGGATTLAQAGDNLQRYLRILNGSEVKGSGLRDAQRIMADTQSSLQALTNSYDRFMKSLGASLAGPAVPVIDKLTEGLDRGRTADDIRRQKSGSLWNWYKSGGSIFDDDVIAGDQKQQAAAESRRRQSLLRRPSRKGGVIPDFAAGKAGANDRASSAFAAFPTATAAPPVAAGNSWAAVEQLKAGMNAKIGADTSAFTASMDGVKGVLRDFAAGATAVLTVDTSAAMAKINEVQRAMRGLSGGASGSYGAAAPTPARVAGAGSAP